MNGTEIAYEVEHLIEGDAVLNLTFSCLGGENLCGR